MLKLATQDSLHQETRLIEFPEIKSIMEAALNGGALGSILSGSGPSIMVFSKGNEFTINYEIEEAARKHNLEGNIILTKPHNQGILIK
jgi:homoserine kinase